MEDYTVMGNKNVIHKIQSYSTIGQVYVYEKAFPSNPLIHINIHIVDDSTLPANAIPNIVKEKCPSSVPKENTYVIDLEGQIIGNFFLRGLVFDSISEPMAFFNDLRSGSMNLIILNLDKTRCPDTMGMFLKYMIELCKDVQKTTIHFILSEKNLYENLKSIDTGIRPDYFVKYGDKLFSDDNEE